MLGLSLPALPVLRCFALAAVATIALANAAQATQCSFYDAQTGEAVDDACTVAFEGDAEIIMVADKRITFVQTARQGQWAIGMLDGKPGMRYEIDRTRYSYATQDLTRFLDRTDE